MQAQLVKQLRADLDRSQKACKTLQAKIEVLEAQIVVLKAQIQRVKDGQSRWIIDSVLNNNAQLRHWTGVPSIDDFKALLVDLNCLPDKKMSVHHRSFNELDLPSPGKALTGSECLFIALAKIRQGISHQVLASLFKVSLSQITAVVRFMITCLYCCFQRQKIIRWLDPQESVNAIPARAANDWRGYSRVHLADCTYVYLQHPGDQQTQSATWCVSKGTNLVKFLVFCGPNGFVEYAICGGSIFGSRLGRCYFQLRRGSQSRDGGPN